MNFRDLRMFAAASAVVFSAAVALCQSDGKRPEFEVAVIKPAPPPAERGMRIMMGGDPGRVNQSNITIRDMMRQAYQVKDFQISGPDWMQNTRFDVVATIPAGSKREDIPLMWQALLADRFKLTLHREQKELPVYALMVGKGGPKMKESEVQPAADPRPGAPGPPMGPGRRGMIQMGRGRLSASASTVANFAELLSRQMDRPVVDQTGLTGNYDFSLEWTPDERQRMQFMPGMAGPPPGAEDRLRPGPGGGGGGEGSQPTGPTIFVAVQEQLGLKMEAKKSPVEILVIDHAEKAPTEN